jgi:hypothetical protein
MPERSGYIASGILHLGLVLLFLFGLPNFFRHKLPEETPLVVQLVKLGPETRATKLTKTPPTPEAKPEIAEEPPPPKPEPPKPEAKPEPKPQPPPQVKPPAPQPAPPEPPPPQPPQPKPVPPTPPPPIPQPKPPPPPQPKAAPVVPPPAPPPPKPTPPKPKADQTQAFDSLLKNLSKNDAARSAPDQPRQNVQPRQQRASSQPIAPLGSQLTASELDLVKQQIEQCWNVPAGARDAQDLTPEFRVSMNPDATVRGVVLLNTERYGDPVFRAAADSARRALLNPECSPLKLPLDKYNQWQTFTITFDPKDIAG